MKTKEHRIKVKVFKVDKSSQGYCYECGNKEEIIRGITKWDEVSRERYAALNGAISHANACPGGKTHYFLVTEMDLSDLTEIFDTAEEYMAWIKREDAKRENERRIASEKRKASSLARKQKQLERLKAELE